MYSETSFLRVKLMSAQTYDDLPSTPLMIRFDSRGDELTHGQIVFHLADAQLVRDLAAAINNVLAAHADKGLPELTELDP